MTQTINMIKRLGLISLFSITSAYAQTKSDAVTDTQNLKFTVEEAPEWSALFNRTSGWFGGDGIFAIPLDGKENVYGKSSTETMWIFSDTMIGEIKDGKLQPGQLMVHNSIAYLKGTEPKKEKINFLYQDEAGKPISMFAPKIENESQKGDYFWLGDGFVNTELNNTIYIFGFRMKNLDANNDWSFTPQGNELIAIPAGSKPPFRNQRHIKTPLLKGHFGIGVFANTKKSGVINPDGYIYVYGLKEPVKSLLAARVKAADIEDMTAWRYWDGKIWNNDINSAAPVAEGVSNEVGVTALPDGRYALTFQEFGMSPVVGLKVGPTPYGPFGQTIKLYEAPEAKDKRLITYNAKAHPHLSAPGELLISYNVNAFEFTPTLKAIPNLYRPRFIKLKFK